MQADFINSTSPNVGEAMAALMAVQEAVNRKIPKSHR